MKIERLSYKVFWATLIGLMIFIVVWVVLQTKFFGTFYTYQKTKELSQQFEEVYKLYADGRYELNSKPIEVYQFEQRFYGLTAALYQRGTQIEVYTGGYITMPAMPMSPAEKPPNYEIDIHSGSPSNSSNEEKLLPSIPASSNSGINTDQLKTTLNTWLQHTDRLKALSKPGQISVTNISSLDDRNENMLLAAVKLPDAVNQSGGAAYLIALATLKPVGDAVQVMSRFYVYFYAMAVLLVMLFAFFFSRTITSPLVHLNKVAKQLAKLDFSASARINRKDEIGQLAETMNHLALNLQTTMAELQEANAKLLADIEKEKQLEQLRKQFVASVSHELKTPVSLIQGYAEALKDNVGHGLKRDKYAGVIIEESERMARLVSDLLDLSQLESGRFALQWTQVPIHEIVRSVLNKMMSFIHEKSIRLEWVEHLEQELWVRSDRQRLEQVLINLLGNAIRHVPIGGQLTLRVIPESSWVRVEIENEGQPIAEEDLPYIWDTFYRADRSGSREFGGTGIGLSIVKAILQRHGSSYGVRNEDNGVTFCFTLPLEENIE
ncbi:sensor histidine kinase [Paenibacillus aceris]|uniref:histidine kinase n=1 Tax=Paenibacillus aceris TaxID=869555 RepID=A0ABS4I8A0_9BACL|nr:ATP-binding protein [Paenibacillus aceris]MBP1967165.1 signal transduction histidine kinase [Paenibacillus aceris]NHW35563.1 HAMP domain-containing protein [Paenibacillus aceris]